VLSASVAGRPVLGVTIAVTASRPTTAALVRARALDVCSTGSALRVVTFLRLPLGTRGPVVAPVEKGTVPAPSAPAMAAPRAEVLGAQFSKPARGFDAARALLLAAAGTAIVLLGLAALPATALAGPRLARLVDERRTDLALAGAGVLLGAVLAYLAGAG
jgi:hypothetical protein